MLPLFSCLWRSSKWWNRQSKGKIFSSLVAVAQVNPSPLPMRHDPDTVIPINCDSIQSGQAQYSSLLPTGKSFLMHKVIKKLKTIKTKFKYGQVAVTATTGLAATNIGGVTLHTYFGLGNGDGTVDELYRKISRTASYPGGAYNKWMRVRALVVDEVSMLDGNLFDKIEALARKFKGNDRPFGGIQLLLVGDFLQLPPVGKNGAVKFAFEAKSWDKCVDVHVELKEVFRQSDKAFVSALNSIRWGKVTPEVSCGHSTLTCTTTISMRVRDTREELWFSYVLSCGVGR
jgi:ATP-dependent DNA helicase PIF1